MSDLAVLSAEVRRAVDGDPWYGRSAIAILEGVDAADAAAVPAGAAHSIWQIVLHMATWARHMAYRVGGGPPREPAGGDWPIVVGSDEKAWSEALEDLRRSHEELAVAVEAASLEALEAVGPETPVDDSGEPITLLRAVLGVPQHDAYHCGQIAVLKRPLSGA